MGEAASKLRGELGESLATVQKFDVPLAEATTSSLEALKAYSLGLKAAYEKGHAAALPYGQRAIQLDPNFALGYDALGTYYYSLGETGRGSHGDYVVWRDDQLSARRKLRGDAPGGGYMLAALQRRLAHQAPPYPRRDQRIGIRPPRFSRRQAVPKGSDNCAHRCMRRHGRLVALEDNVRLSARSANHYQRRQNPVHHLLAPRNWHRVVCPLVAAASASRTPLACDSSIVGTSGGFLRRDHPPPKRVCHACRATC